MIINIFKWMHYHVLLVLRFAKVVLKFCWTVLNVRQAESAINFQNITLMENSFNVKYLENGEACNVGLSRRPTENPPVGFRL